MTLTSADTCTDMQAGKKYTYTPPCCQIQPEAESGQQINHQLNDSNKHGVASRMQKPTHEYAATANHNYMQQHGMHEAKLTTQHAGASTNALVSTFRRLECAQNTALNVVQVASPHSATT